LHATLPGLGVFNNDPREVAKAFNYASKRFHDTLTDQQKNQIRVVVSVYTANLDRDGIDLSSHMFLKCVGLPVDNIRIMNRYDSPCPDWAKDDYESKGDEFIMKSNEALSGNHLTEI
jgi:hypothetical protein